MKFLVAYKCFRIFNSIDLISLVTTLAILVTGVINDKRSFPNDSTSSSNEALVESLHLNTSFTCMWLKTHFHKECVPSLALITRLTATGKWPIDNLSKSNPFYAECKVISYTQGLHCSAVYMEQVRITTILSYANFAGRNKWGKYCLLLYKRLWLSVMAVADWYVFSRRLFVQPCEKVDGMYFLIRSS